MPISDLRRIMMKAATVVVVTTALIAVFALHGGHAISAQAMLQPRVLIVGGGSSHNFDEAYGKLDLTTLTAAGDSPRYTSSFKDISRELQTADVLIQASNQTPGPDADARRAIVDFVTTGGGLIVVHAGTWYNWPDWPEYNRMLVGGGTHSHDKFGEFEVTVTAPEHPVMKGVPAHFKISDELYHQKIDPQGSPVEVLATATSPLTGKTFPSIWVVKQGLGRIVCITLGHDEKSHGDPTYARILVNATSWTAKRSPSRR